MENKALRILEYDKIQKVLAEFTTNPAVTDRILALAPTDDLQTAQAWQRETTEATALLLRYGYPKSMSAPQVTGAVRRCMIGGILSARDLLQVASLLSMARLTKQYLAQAEADDFPVLSGLGMGLTAVKPLEEKIGLCILAEDEIADGASANLATIRRKMRSLQDKIKELIDGIVRSGKYQKYLQDALVTMRGGRYVIPVKSEHRSEIPGVVHDTSATGATLFIEPMSVVNANNEIRDLAAQEQAEIERILAELSAEVSEYGDAIVANYNALCEIDFIFCKGKLSVKYGCVEPRLNDRGEIFIKRGRHPLINARSVVANDIYLGKDFDTLVITGPNTGGKTVTLKTVGLFSIMAACGLHIPANDNSEMAVFASVWADIGDEQSIEQNLSTFSSHMKNITEILKHAGYNSLVLFDELGAGTDPVEGAALAVSILESLRAKGAKVAATTHYSELKLFALSTPGVCNASCEFNVQTLQPTYKLLIGVPGKSNAFAISERLGLEKAIIERAKAIMSDEDVRFEDVIGDLQESRRLADEEAKRAVSIRAEMDKLRKTMEMQKSELDGRRKKILDEARQEARRIILDAKEESAQVIKELNKLKKNIRATDADRTIEESRRRLKGKEDAIDASFSDVIKVKKHTEAPKTVAVGDFVEVVTIGQTAEVLKAPDGAGNVYVQCGTLKMNVKLADLRLAERPQEPKKRKKAPQESSYVSRRADVKGEIDLRGQMLEDALYETDKYLADAYSAGLTQVSIIHGKGTGVLRSGIAEMLKKHKLVKSYRLGLYGEGENGVTIVELK